MIMLILFKKNQEQQQNNVLVSNSTDIMAAGKLLRMVLLGDKINHVGW